MSGKIFMNSTISAPAPPQYQLVLSLETTKRIRWAFIRVMLPCVGLMGVVGNVVVVVTIARQGFRKCSNILLVALAGFDILYLIGVNNFPQIMLAESMNHMWEVSRDINYVIYVIFQVSSFAEINGSCVSFIIPALMTGERLLAIFMPLIFRNIVTPMRTLSVISCLGALYFFFYYYIYLMCMKYTHVLSNQSFVGAGMVYTAKFYEDDRSGVYDLILDVANHASKTAPLVFVTVGSVIIGLRVRVITNRRGKLTAGGVKAGNKLTSKAAVSRTTSTLLSVCVLYSLCCSFGQITIYVGAVLADYNIQSILLDVRALLYCLNSVGNFFIYTTINKTFKFQYMEKCFSS